MLIEVGDNGVGFEVFGGKRLLKWSEIVGVSRKERGYIFLKSGEGIYMGDYSVVTVHYYGRRDIGVGSYTVHCGWTNFTQILKENIVSHGGKYIDEFEGLYTSFRLDSFTHSNWKEKLSPEEAKDRKILFSLMFIFFMFWVFVFVIYGLVFGGEQLNDFWGLVVVVMFLGIFLFGFTFIFYYHRQSKTDKILERLFPEAGVGNNE